MERRCQGPGLESGARVAGGRCGDPGRATAVTLFLRLELCAPVCALALRHAAKGAGNAWESPHPVQEKEINHDRKWGAWLI